MYKYVVVWRYHLGDIQTQERAFKTPRAAMRALVGLKDDGVAHIRIEYRDEVHNIPNDEYIKPVEQYDSLTELSAEILKEAAVYGGVDTGTLQEMAADVEAWEPRAKGLADAVGRVRGVLEQLNE